MKVAILIRTAVAATVVGYGILIAANHLALQELKVNGPIYSKITQSKDLVADILPPPLYVAEGLLEALRVVKDSSRLPSARKRIDELRKEYGERHAFWSGQQLEPLLARQLLNDAHGPAMRFWEIIDKQLLPAIERNLPAAVDTAIAKADAEFETHRAHIERAVTEANRIAASSEAHSHKVEARWSYAVWTVALLVALISIAVGVGLTRFVLIPLDRLRETMVSLAGGNRDLAVFGIGRQDEIGAMAETIEIFRLAAIDRAALEERQLENRANEIERQQLLEQVVNSFRKDISGVIETLNLQTGLIRNASANFSSAAGRTTEDAQVATRASQGAAENAHAVAAATEELGASIREIASQAHRTSDLVAQTTAATRKSNADVAGLADAAQKIGSIVEIIKTVAEQTNLLALNATIEAARAGEAGKGFAVVATEVKNLAAQTAEATSAISSQIQNVQCCTELAVEAIRGIAGRIDEINNLTGGIAAAVEEQEAATREIARNVTTAAGRSRVAAESIGGVLSAADQTRTESATMGEMSTRIGEATRLISQRFESFVKVLSSDLAARRKSVCDPFDRAVSVTSGPRRYETRAQDVNRHGMRVAFVPGIVAGARVMLDFGMGAVPAKCLWTDSRAAGMAFEGPLAVLPDANGPELGVLKAAA